VLTVGVDAGGTGSRAVVVRDGTVVERRDLGPINVLLHADAVDRLAAAIAGADGAGLGLAGLRSAEDAGRIAAELTGRTGVRVAVGDDTDAALAGAFAGGPGIVVIAGTGSGAAGRAGGVHAGPASRVGGHGFLLGDEGGGYWIGRQAVAAALRAADGTGPPTALTAVVEAAFGSLTGAEQQVHRAPADRGLLARLVPAVAATDDPLAAGLLAEAGNHLADLADALRARLGPLPVAGVGGIFRCAPVRAAFTARTGAVDPLEPPELGALRLL
jgi:glucosamine kinase